MAAPLDSLVNPPFATNPPIKLRVDAKMIGLVIAILSALVGLLALWQLLALFTIGYQTSYAGLYVLFLIDIVVNLVADVMALTGGWQMYRGNPSGKRLAIYGLALAFLVQLVLGLGFGTGVSAIVTLILLAVLYYAVVVSRFPGDAIAPNR